MSEQFEDRDTEPMIKAAAPVNPPVPSPHVVDVEYVRLSDTVLDVSPTQTYFIKLNRKMQAVQVRRVRIGEGKNRDQYLPIRTKDGKRVSRTVTTSSLYLPRAEAERLALAALGLEGIK